jgi:hypothetical protein
LFKKPGLGIFSVEGKDSVFDEGVVSGISINQIHKGQSTEEILKNSVGFAQK